MFEILCVLFYVNNFKNGVWKLRCLCYRNACRFLCRIKSCLTQNRSLASDCPSEMWHIVSSVVRILTSDRLLIIILLTYFTWQLPFLPHHHQRGFFDGNGKGRVLAEVKKFFFPSTRNLFLRPFILVGVPERGLGAQ